MKAVTVRPSGPIRGEITPPGDKSITHRAFLLATLAEGEIRVQGANPAEDCERSLAVVAALGVPVERRPGEVALQGRGGSLAEPEDVLDCGNSGTTLRLAAGILAGQPFHAVLSGDASLRRRPMDRVVAPLRAMGASLTGRCGDRYPPLVVRGAALRAIEHRSEVASAQVKSCLLLAALYARGRTRVLEPRPSRDHTERLLGALGVSVESSDLSDGTREVVLVGPVRPGGGLVRVPSDYSAGAFLLLATALCPGSETRVRGVGLNPTRTGFQRVLQAMGVELETEDRSEPDGEPRGNVCARGPSSLDATRIDGREVPSLIDELPAWAVAAACARGTSELSGASELRVKESDRLATLARNLTRLGIAVEERADGLRVHGGTLGGGVVDSSGDHRIAMAFTVAGLAARAPVTVTGIESVATSYPGFFDDLRALGAQLELHETADAAGD